MATTSKEFTVEQERAIERALYAHIKQLEKELEAPREEDFALLRYQLQHAKSALAVMVEG